MKIGEVIQRVLSLINSGIEADNFYITHRHVYNKLVSTRALLLSQKVNKRQEISRWDYQVLSGLPLESGNIPGNTSSCKVSKLKKPLPRILSGMDGLIIQSVSALNGKQVFDQVSFRESAYQSGSKYVKDKPTFHIWNDTIYFNKSLNIENITISALFEDPFEAYRYGQECLGNDCPDSPLDIDIRIDPSLVDAIIELTMKELLIMRVKEKSSKNAKEENNV